MAVALDMREGLKENNLFDRLCADPRLGFTGEELESLVGDPMDLTGAAQVQVQTIVAKVTEIVARYPQAALYRPGAVL